MPDKLFDISGKVAVVTGGTGVLGGAMAKELGRRGVKVAVLGRSEEKANAAVEHIRGEGGTAIAVTVDVVEQGSCEKAKDRIVSEFGQIDFLVNCAGGNHPDATATPDKSFFELSPEAMKWVVELNLNGTVLPCQVFGKVIADQGHGSIVNISSMAALRPLTKVVGYSAAKAAVSNFTNWLSIYMCQNFGEKVRVNAIAPGFFLTEQNRYLLTDKATGNYTDRGQTVINQTPMNRFGDPDELSGTLVWLLSPASSFVTGTVIAVDGGFSAFSGV
jgi:NAD(P)-dependent dehydrogenase (short-subunit alcohol dehydrogenase family)